MNGQSPASLTSNGITPVQQMVSSCSGALLTSLFGEIFDLTVHFIHLNKQVILHIPQIYLFI